MALNNAETGSKKASMNLMAFSKAPSSKANKAVLAKPRSTIPVTVTLQESDFSAFMGCDVVEPDLRRESLSVSRASASSYEGMAKVLLLI